MILNISIKRLFRDLYDKIIADPVGQRISGDYFAPIVSPAFYKRGWALT